MAKRAVDTAKKITDVQLMTSKSGAAREKPEQSRSRSAVPKTNSRVRTVFFVVILLAAIGSAGYFWNESRLAKQETVEGVAARNQVESEEVLNSLSSILLIDESAEEPTVARVEDPETLKESNQEFYNDVQLGDHLILYPDRAIIYRSSEDKIINVAPIIDTSNTQQLQAQPAEDEASAEASETQN